MLIPGLIPPAELAPVDADSLALIEKGLGGPFGDSRWNYGEDASELVPRRINGLVDDDMPESFRLLLAYPPLLAAAAACMADVNGESKAFAASVPGALVYKVSYPSSPNPHNPHLIRIILT